MTEGIHSKHNQELGAGEDEVGEDLRKGKENALSHPLLGDIGGVLTKLAIVNALRLWLVRLQGVKARRGNIAPT